jgi:hypothetical protein
MGYERSMYFPQIFIKDYHDQTFFAFIAKSQSYVHISLNMKMTLVYDLANLETEISKLENNLIPLGWD